MHCGCRVTVRGLLLLIKETFDMGLAVSSQSVRKDRERYEQIVKRLEQRRLVVGSVPDDRFW